MIWRQQTWSKIWWCQGLLHTMDTLKGSTGLLSSAFDVFALVYLLFAAELTIISDRERGEAVSPRSLPSLWPGSFNPLGLTSRVLEILIQCIIRHTSPKRRAACHLCPIEPSSVSDVTKNTRFLLDHISPFSTIWRVFPSLFPSRCLIRHIFFCALQPRDPTVTSSFCFVKLLFTACLC